ncbi:MAG: helix-turn-helix transcriptional regulator [Chloroflexi bacterium]|nr:helix-turn-helix transcriptional regulator [Chloroflexota bacterium]
MPAVPEACEPRAIHPERVTRGRALLLGDESYVALAETFRSLADSSRARIIHSLAEQELCVCDLAAVVGMSEPAVSQHLRMLRNLRIVRPRREGKVVYYSLDDAHIRVLLSVSLSHLGHTPGA